MNTTTLLYRKQKTPASHHHNNPLNLSGFLDCRSDLTNVGFFPFLVGCIKMSHVWGSTTKGENRKGVTWGKEPHNPKWQKYSWAHHRMHRESRRLHQSSNLKYLKESSNLFAQRNPQLLLKKSCQVNTTTTTGTARTASDPHRSNLLFLA